MALPFRRSCSLAALAAFTLPACSTAKDWREVDAGAVPFEDCWTAVAEVCRVDGFAPDQAGTDRGLKVFETRWRSRELAFGRGYRKRVHAEFAQDEVTRRWTIRFYCEQQKVPEFAKELEPAEADWKANGQDKDVEDRLAAKLAYTFQSAAARAR